MFQILTREFANRSRSDVPDLFSRTHGFRFLAGSGRLSHRILPRRSKGTTVVNVSSTGHEAGFVEERRTALTIPISGSSRVRVADREFAVRPGELFAIGPSERHSRLLPSGEGSAYKSYTILSGDRHDSSADTERCWHKSNRRKYFQLKHLLDLSFDIFSERQRVSEKAAALIEALIEEMFVELLTYSPDYDVAAHDTHLYDRVVNLAQELMVASLSEPVTTHNIAAAVGVSQRLLQRAFKSRHGHSPRQALADMRLRNMHKTLMDPLPETSVTSAALDSGLVHLGRCSRAYHEKYGELPSQTLRKARDAKT